MSTNLATQDPENWTVIVFMCPAESWQRVLIEMFSHLRRINEAQLPHFLIRSFDQGRYVVSLRILREPSAAHIVEGSLNKFLVERNLEIIGANRTDRLSGWISEWNDHWNRPRCEALNHLSEVVVLLAENELFHPEDRRDMAHYYTIMLGLYEVGRSQDNRGRTNGGYIDLFTRNAWFYSMP